MADTLDLTFVGQHSTYRAVDQHVLAVGRVSVFYKVVADHAASVDAPLCVKSFHNPPEGPADGFTKELGVLQQLNHPNILRLVDFGFRGSGSAGPFLVLPYCNGGNLRRFLDGRKFVALTAALPILEQIATGLDYAHKSGVIHGDVKPENILLSDERGTSAWLADFGVAKYFAFEETVRTIQPGDQVEGGTLLYLSPEQLDDKSYSIRSDIYSFGLVAYELLCGSLPFARNESLYRQMRAKVTGNLIDPRDQNPGLSEATAQALRQALSLDPKQRPASAQELCRLLLTAQPESKPRAASSAVPTPASTDAPTNTSRVAIWVAVIAAIGGLLTAIAQNLPQLLGKVKPK
jgi:serine/threonine protein kinase